MSENHLLALLRRGAEGRGEAAFAELSDGREVAYAAFWKDVERAHAALAALGVRPGDRVAAQTPKSLEALILYLGAVAAGAAFLPLNTAYTAEEVGFFLGDAEPALFVCDPAGAETLRPVAEAAGTRLATLDGAGGGDWAAAVAAASPGRADAPRGEDDLAAILYTSGTTGRSKGAMLSHRNLASNAEALAALWGFTAEEALIHALPVFHVHGLFVATNVALVAGARVILQPKFDAEAVLAAMPRATALMGVPTFYTRLLEQPGLAEAARGMRLFVSGSAPMLAETHARWRDATGHSVLERYGMTEAGMITSNPLEGERRPGAVGFPLPGVELRVVDAEGGPVPAGETGSIEIRGPNLFLGYWRMPEKTAEEMRPDGFFVTGDLGRIDAEGYLHIVGRAKDLVISGGYNVYPKEVEALIDRLPGVVESAVFGAPHPDLGEAVVAAIVPEAADPADEAQVLEALSGRLARFKQPRRVFAVEALPRNAMGKVQKAALRQRFGDVFGT